MMEQFGRPFGGGSAVTAAVEVGLSAFQRELRLELRLDGRLLQTLVVELARRTYRLGPLAMTPGHHQLVFHAAEAPAVPDQELHNGDTRAVSFAVGAWSWHVPGTQR